MSRIVVVPEQLRSLSSQLQQAAADLRSMSSRLNSAYSGLDWDARQRAGTESQWNSARSRATALADQAEAMARLLSSKAQTFEAADQQGSASIPSLPQLSLPQLLPAALSWPFSTIPMAAIAGLALPQIAWPPKIDFQMPSLSLPSWLTGQGQQQGAAQAQSGGGSGGAAGQQATTSATSHRPQPVALNPNVKPENYDSSVGCVRYAQDRRPDLGVAPAPDGGAASYIDKFKDKAFQVSSGAGSLQNQIATGYAIVWPRHDPALQGTPGYDLGHVAIVEEVGPDYVVVSQAGWPGKPTMKLTTADLGQLYVIP